MGEPLVIRTDGEDLVVLKRSDYEALLARADDEAAEDIVTARILDASDARIARGEDAALPSAVCQAVENGGNPVRVIRSYRRLTQAEVAQRTGLAQNDIAEIETGEKTATPAALAAIAAALAVPLDLLKQ